ncbi:5-carboxymethyl-2-hydroxymuconate semialdehyde dehydrogenase [Arthrobacter sp. Hiyo4]|nr:5-carboxymethyl-2-hydroxymuconate semialdehyde dehydrogenase [Arthrobacter sp. Hiyo4]
MTFTAEQTTNHYVPQDLPTHIQHYINGQFVDSLNGATFDVLDPVSNTNYATAAAGQKEDIDLAVAAAREAFTKGPWPRMKPRERARVLNRIADAVEAQEARLAELETFDTGLPITQAKGQALRAAENFRFFADLIVAQFDDAMKVPGAQINYVNRKPIGVAGLITPWNTPFMLESWKLAPALATGNTVVLKPAEFTPLSASLWATIFKDAGLPDGVFNLVNGLGEDAGDALVKHPDVPLISFTGETTTGQTIFRNAAANLKGLSMELGGKSPCVVFADADLDAAIDSALFGVFSLNGERCTAGSRILVERAIYDEFCEKYAARAKNIVVGDPHDPKTEVGALVHPEHYAKVASYVEVGKTEGRLLAGGGRPATSPKATTSHPPCSPTSPRRADLPGGNLRSRRRDHPVRERRRGAGSGEQHPIRPGGLHLDPEPDPRAQLLAERRSRHGLAEQPQRPRPPHPVRRRQSLRPGPRRRLPLHRLLHRPAGRPHQPRHRSHPKFGA